MSPSWLETKAIPFVEKWWKPIAFVVLVVIGFLIGKDLFGLLDNAVHAVLGKVDDPKTFTPIAGDPVHVIVSLPGGASKVVRLPEGADGKQLISSDPNLRVGYGAGYTAKASNDGPQTDRR